MGLRTVLDADTPTEAGTFPVGMSCPSWQLYRTGYRWLPVRTLPVALLWCNLGCCSRTVMVIKLRRTSTFMTWRILRVCTTSSYLYPAPSPTARMSYPTSSAVARIMCCPLELIFAQVHHHVRRMCRLVLLGISSSFHHACVHWCMAYSSPRWLSAAQILVPSRSSYAPCPLLWRS